MKLNPNQIKSAISELGKELNSENQHYFCVLQNRTYQDREAGLHFDINKSIDNELLIPFVPAFDL